MHHVHIKVVTDERESVPNSFTPPKPRAKKDSPLLTVRSDLTEVREALLEGSNRKALGPVDYTLDCIDEYIAEGGQV